MQQSIVHKRLQRGVCDSWEWIGAPFSVRGEYKRFCKGQYVEDRLIIKACQFIWRQKVPLKVCLFCGLLLRSRLMTRVIHRQLYLGTSADCLLCSGVEEDCAHLFFECPFARTIWTRQPISRVNTTSEMSFWDLIRRSNYKKRADRVCILAVLWAIWLHWNDKLFNGTATSTNGVTYAVEGFLATWSSSPRGQGAKGLDVTDSLHDRPFHSFKKLK